MQSMKNKIYHNLRRKYRGMVVTCGMMPPGKGAETTPSSSKEKEHQKGRNVFDFGRQNQEQFIEFLN